MALLLTYYSPAIPSRSIAGWSEDIVAPYFVRMGDFQGVIGEAQLGAVGISSVRIDDPDGQAGHLADDIVGWKQMAITESDAPAGNHRIWTGYIGKRNYARGTGVSPSMITGAARVIDMDLIDLNSFLSFRVFHAPDDNDANRPAETDAARITWMLAHSYLSTILFDSGLVNLANPVNLDATDFRGQHPQDVLNDAAQQSGKNYFVYYHEADGKFSLFYDKNDSPVFLADPFAVSNVLGDVPLDANGYQIGPTWAPSLDAQLARDPSRVVAGVYLPNGSNTAVYRSLALTADTYGWRDVVSPAANLKTTALIAARGDRYLAENSTEDDTITFSLQLPAAHVNDCHEGQSFMFKASHLPGYGSARRVRVMKRQVAMKQPTDAFYEVQYECTPMLPTAQGAFAASVYGIKAAVPELPHPTTPGRVLLAVVMAQGTISNFPANPRIRVTPAQHGAPNWDIPPFADLGGWTLLNKATTDYSAMAIGGPCGFATYQPTGFSCTGGMLVAVVYRTVGMGEITKWPAAFGTEDAHDHCWAWMWEMPAGTVPTAGAVADNRSNLPLTATVGPVVGNTLAAFVWATSAGHSPVIMPISQSAISGTMLQATTSDNNPAIGTSNVEPWSQIVQLPAGGSPSVGLVANAMYNGINWAGAAVVLPPGVTLPTIPYPLNQVG